MYIGYIGTKENYMYFKLRIAFSFVFLAVDDIKNGVYAKRRKAKTTGYEVMTLHC